MFLFPNPRVYRRGCEYTREIVVLVVFAAGVFKNDVFLLLPRGSVRYIIRRHATYKGRKSEPRVRRYIRVRDNVEMQMVVVCILPEPHT